MTVKLSEPLIDVYVIVSYKEMHHPRCRKNDPKKNKIDNFISISCITMILYSFLTIYAVKQISNN